MSKFKFWLKQKSPEILITFGILNSAAAIVLACLATKKTVKILIPVKMNVAKYHNKMDNLLDDDPKKAEYKQQLKKLYVKAGKKIAITYIPVVLSFVLSVASIIGSHKILKGRNIALAAAFTTLKTGYDAYRERVREKIGEGVEEEIYEGSTITKIVDKDENGKKTVTKLVKPNEQLQIDSDFSVCWGPGQSTYDKNANGLNLTALLQMEQWFNDNLAAKGYVFLSEVYEQLGFSAAYLGHKKLQASHVLGWIYVPEDTTRDSYISFGLHDKEGKLTQQARDLQNGLVEFIWLTFNVDGDILTESNGSKAFMKMAMTKDH